MKYPDFDELTIKEIKDYTKDLETDDSLIELANILSEDERKGVKRIAKN